EGTRATKDVIQPFKTGAFRLAKAGQVAILPVGIYGTRALLPKHGRLIKPGHVRVTIGAPLPAAEVQETALGELAERTRQVGSGLAGLPRAASTATSSEGATKEQPVPLDRLPLA